MNYRFFSVSARYPNAIQDELNSFCNTHRIISIEKQFVSDGEHSFWAICISYQEGGDSTALVRRSKIDYKKVLSAEDFALFAKLRELRKTLAQQQGVPAYALFTNEQLAEMAKRRVSSAAALDEIDGVGQSRVDKYGSAFLSAIEVYAKTQSDTVEPSGHETHPD
jgi:superfamily II DNA helicase RecQ